MLSVEEILNLVAGGEGYNVDFKRSVPSKVYKKKEFWSTRADGVMGSGVSICDGFLRTGH